MISERGRKAVDKIMKYGCFLKIYPYSWNSKSYRLDDAPIWHLVIYHFRRYMVLVTFTFMFFRMIQSLKDDLPSRIRIMNFIWVAAYGLVVMCNIQFEMRRDAIQFFANALFAQLDRTRPELPGKLQRRRKRKQKVIEEDKSLPLEAMEKQKGREAARNAARKRLSLDQVESLEDGYQDEAQKKKKEEEDAQFDFVSAFVLLSTFLLLTNPAAHSTVLFDIPCAPQYMSSLVFDCQSAMDDPAPIWQKGLFVLLENWIISDMMFAWTFNWALCFLGLTWVKQEVQRFEGKIAPNKRSPLDFEVAVAQYRRIQAMLVVINDAFRLYLQFFPSILFTIAGMLLFGTIRYTHLPFHAYIVFPFCGVRCIFEAGTALAAAGWVNQESKNYLLQWDREIDQVPDKMDQKYLKVFRRSCGVLKCMAGSLYSFENSIFLVSLSNCAQLTFNMFVTFKPKHR